MKTYFSSLGTVALTALAVISTLVSCQDTDYPTPQPATGPSTVQARALFVHAAPGAPALNFLVNNEQAGQARSFGEATGYNAFGVGPAQFRARGASGPIGGVIGSNDILFRAGATNDNNFAAVANTAYTVFVTDTLNRPRPNVANGTNPGGPQFLVVTDNLAAPTAGNAHVRFFHLAPNVGPVSVRLRATGATTDAATFLGRGYRAISSGTGATTVNFANFTPVPAGTYTVEVFTGGTITGTPVLTVPNVTLGQGKIVTLYARGLNRGTGATALGAGVVQHN